ncbi:hypothetical protein ACHAXA_011771 [Cyclostephanos tholiformis]|uniref:Transmembrane protein n=1 Tax=Cyclostephanos tholiformis TaxID=382380 RepID=A0ABD3R2W5_9STRA
MSFVARTRRRRLQVAVAMDSDEAEIVEFYEREEMMERGGTPPPSKKGHGVEVEQGDEGGEDVKEWRRNLPDETRCKGDDGGGPRGDDPFDQSSRGGAPREHPRCDLYYSWVLGQILDYDDEDVGDGTRPLADEGVREVKVEERGIHRDAQCDDDGNSIHNDDRDFQDAVLETFSSLTSDEDKGGAVDSDGDGELRQDQVDPTPADVQTTPYQEQSAELTDCELLMRTQTAKEGHGQRQEREQEHTHHRPPSPLSSSSSISPLTSEGFDIEAASASRRERVQKINATNSSCASTSFVMPRVEGHVSGRPSVPHAATNVEDYVASSTGDTPPRSDLHNDQSRCTALRRQRDFSSRRHVSFSSEVEVCNIPPRPAATVQTQADELSFEGYLYIMLIAVAIAIAVFSLVPAHPSLSPLHSKVRGDIFQLTDNLLKSQWDVEL